MDKYELRPMRLSDVPEEEQGRAKSNITSGIAMTLLINDTVIGVAGVRLFWDGVGHAWLFKVARRQDIIWKAIKIYEIIEKEIEVIREKYKLHRLQATAVAENIIGQKFLKRLGFKEEGLLEMYGEDKADSIMFAKVWRG
jgi:RimJ/RimL family protein N-acetyltransferase